MNRIDRSMGRSAIALIVTILVFGACATTGDGKRKVILPKADSAAEAAQTETPQEAPEPGEPPGPNWETGHEDLPPLQPAPVEPDFSNPHSDEHLLWRITQYWNNKVDQRFEANYDMLSPSTRHKVSRRRYLGQNYNATIESHAYRIHSLEFMDPDNVIVTLIVDITSHIPMMPGKFRHSRMERWSFEDGDWYYYYLSPAEAAFGTMNTQNESPTQGRFPENPRFDPEELKGYQPTLPDGKPVEIIREEDEQ